MDKIRNEYIRETAHVWCVGHKVNTPDMVSRLRWFGRVKRRDGEHISRRMVSITCQTGDLEEDQRAGTERG